MLVGYITYVGNTSMEVEVDTYVEHSDGLCYSVNRAFLVMVAMDEKRASFAGSRASCKDRGGKSKI